MDVAASGGTFIGSLYVFRGYPGWMHTEEAAQPERPQP